MRPCKDTDIIHVMPNNDTMPHHNSKDCPCNTRVDDRIIIHNSFDGREFSEEMLAKVKEGE